MKIENHPNENKMTKKETKIMELLESGDIVTRETLQETVYGWPESMSSNADYTPLRMAISRMKKKGIANIETVRGVGFRLIV